MPAAVCPEASAYQRLIHGELPPYDVERLSEHLAGCPSCAAAVQTILGADTLLSVLRGAPADAPTGEQVPADLTGRLLALRRSSDPSLKLGALSPPQGPGEIGRLAHYRVLKVLGEGGMGVVLLAEDTRLSRTVALKTMKPAVAADPRHRQRFLREARAAAKVEHDHIVPIYDVGEERGVPWLAMPLLKGESLDELLKRVKVLKPAQAVRLGAQVARGLAAAHAAGLIHRDIKPANIWVEPAGGGRARLLDFGLARDQGPQREPGQEHLTQTGAILGTPAFMAPEQANGAPLDARADLFSLGCVLYRAVTGRLPFQGQGTLDMIVAVATETPPAPHEVNPEVPRPLSALIMDLLAKDRSARPESATTVAAALEAIQGKLTDSVQLAVPVAPRQEERDPWADLTEAAEPQAPVPAPRRRWRRATAAALLLALGGALAAGIVVIIKNKDGKEVARVTLPEGVSAEIKQDGDSGKAKVDSVQLDPDRRAAEWVLSIGGTIKIRREGQEREIRAAKDLPVAAFEVASVSLLDNKKVGDAELEHLKGLTSLIHLELTGTRVSDAGLEHLKGLTNLMGLALGGTRVSDAGLEHLSGLTNLTVLWLGNTRVSDAGLVQLKGLTSLRWLELGGTRVSDAGLVHLKGLTNLTELHLWNTRVSDAGLEHLKGLTQLTVLHLWNTRVSDAGLEQLKGLTNLTWLWLGNTRVSDAGLVHLKGQTSLIGLQLGDTRVSDAGLVHLKGLTNLRAMLLNITPVSDAGLEHLKGLTQLTELDLGATRVGDAGLEHLKGLTKLTILNLHGTRVSDACVKLLAGLGGLKHLDLTGTLVTADGLAALQKALPNCKIVSGASEGSPDRRAAEWVLSIGGWIKIRLEGQDREVRAAKDLPVAPFEVACVILRDNQKVDDAQLDHLKGLTSLTWLELGATRVSDAGLEHLKGLTNLTALWLGNSQVGDAGLVHLKGLTSLVQLELGGTRVSDAGLVHLKGLTNLTELHLWNTRVSDAGLEHLKGLTNLMGLALGGTRVTDAGLEHLEGLTNLTFLLLGDTRVSDAGWVHLKKLTSLKALELGGPRVSDAGLVHLKGLPNLRAILLSNTPVSDAGLEHLKGLTQLTDLHLWNTRVSDAGLEHLKGLTNLSWLNLGDTRVGDAGLEHLKELTKLTVLNLHGTRVSDAGLKLLAGLGNLKHLDLSGTQTTAEGVAALQKALPNCKIVSGPVAK